MRYLIILFTLVSAQEIYADWVGNSIKLGSPVIQSQLISSENKIIFEPNPLSEITLSFIGPSYAFGLQFTGEKEDDGDMLDSRYSDFLFSYYTSTYLVDLFFRSFEDFYIQNDRDEMNAAGSADTIQGNTFGIQTVYYPEGDIFKIHGENVLDPQTGYSYFLKFRFEHQNIEASNTIVPSKYQADFQKIKDIQSINIDALDTSVGLSALYATDYIYFNTYLMLGPSFEYYLLEDAESKTVSLISPVAEGFVGLAYYQKNFQLGYRIMHREKASQINGVQFRDVLGTRYFYALWVF